MSKISKKLSRFDFNFVVRNDVAVLEALNKFLRFEQIDLDEYLSSKNSKIKSDYVCDKLKDFSMDIFRAIHRTKTQAFTRQAIIQFPVNTDKPNCMESIHFQWVDVDFSVLEVTCKFRSSDYVQMLPTDLKILKDITDKYIDVLKASKMPINDNLRIIYSCFFSNIHKYEC